MEIRFSDINDDPYEISNIYESSWKYAYKGIIPQEYLDSIPKGRWAASINKKGMQSLVIDDNGKLIGTAGICRSRWERFHDCGEIVSIYLLPEYIGKGIGSKLLKRCIDELKLQGFNKILLWVLEENTRARGFYEKNGFLCTDEYISDNIGGKSLSEIMYILDIK
ncbi:MAG: GNAT family N-acetyltransferase [Ruminococcus sp.]|nr:GNAT family N-acetyltransferase [Ruminococcus sp.]